MLPCAFFSLAFSVSPAHRSNDAVTNLSKPTDLQRDNDELNRRLLKTIEWHIADIEHDITLLRKMNGSKQTIELLEDIKKNFEKSRVALKKVLEKETAPPTEKK